MDRPTKKSGLALAGIILGAIAVALSAVPIINNFAFFLAALALIFGIVGVVQARKRRRDGRGRAIAAIILAVIAVIVVFASQALYGSALNDAGKTINKSLNNATGKNTSQLLKTDVSVQLGQFSATSDQYGSDTTVLPVTVTNKTTKQQTFSVQIEAVDPTGKRIDDDTVYADNLNAKESQGFKAFQYVDSSEIPALRTATFKVSSISED